MWNVDITGEREESGAAAVEMALIAVLLVTLLFGIVEFGRAVWLHQGVSAASREAGRYGSATKVTSGVPQYRDCAGIRAAAKKRTPDLNLTDSQITVAYEVYATSSGPPTVATCPASGSLPSSVVLKSGDQIVVTIQRPTDVNLPFVPLPSYTARAITKRTLYLASTT